MPLDARPPVPLIEIAIESGAPAQADHLCTALSRLAASDPQVTVRTEWPSGKRLLGGISEAQLAAKVAELMREFGDACLIGPPVAVCHETIRRRVEVEFTHDQPVGEPGGCATVKVLFEPAPPGSGFRFINAARANRLPPSVAAALRKGLQSARMGGLVAGNPVTDFWATLLEAGWHDLPPDDRAFEAAAAGAFGELRTCGAPVVLEPVMAIELNLADRLVDIVTSDLERRSARLERVDRTGGRSLVSAVAPVAKLFGYGERLREHSLGGARLTMQFVGYEPMVVSDKSSTGLSAGAEQA